MSRVTGSPLVVRGTGCGRARGSVAVWDPEGGAARSGAAESLSPAEVSELVTFNVAQRLKESKRRKLLNWMGPGDL